MTDTIRDEPGEWWVTTGRVSDGGVRLAGPFPTLGDGITARWPLEEDRGKSDLWVLDASDPDCPADDTEGE
jgi:hypothetical protein